MDLCGMTEATDLHVKLLAANTCYETLRSQARLKDRALSGRKQVLTQDVSMMSVFLDLFSSPSTHSNNQDYIASPVWSIQVINFCS